MSEFSASYHLKSSDKSQAIELIKCSGNRGFVFEETNGWVTFVVEGPTFDVSEALISCNPGLIVHYVYAEDHGWELRVFNKDELVFEYKCDWTDEVVIEKELFNIDVIQELIVHQGNSINGVEELFDTTEFDFDDSPAYRLAKKLGLVHYEWLSIDGIEYRLNEVAVVE